MGDMANYNRRQNALDTIVDVAAGIIVGLGAIALIAAYLWLTPQQRSAECDRQYAQMEVKELS